MMWVTIGLTFLATVSYGIMFQVSARTLLGGGIIGVSGWIVKTVVHETGVQPPTGILLAAISVALFSQVLSRLQKVPATVFIISGIIPLVPGYKAYITMRYLMNKNFLAGMETGMETALSAGSIAAGLIIGESLVRLVKGRKRRHAG
jgi:uncharacterized membrane protein YjjB (DUF3815 family)